MYSCRRVVEKIRETERQSNEAQIQSTTMTSEYGIKSSLKANEERLLAKGSGYLLTKFSLRHIS